MENYLASQKDQVFKNVQILIYVFDVESRELSKDLIYYKSCLQALMQNSPNAQVFCLVHKMDLIEESKRNTSFAEKEREILSYSLLASEYNNPVIKIFCSSIWDETLYKAWSAIVYCLIPNVTQMEEKLIHFAKVIEADEILLFERATFLIIAHAEMTEHTDVHRFEKVSNIIKQFKLSCNKTQSQFDSMHVKNKNYAAFIDTFTANTFIMVILSDANVSPALTLMNIKSARKAFEKLEAR